MASHACWVQGLLKMMAAGDLDNAFLDPVVVPLGDGGIDPLTTHGICR